MYAPFWSVMLDAIVCPFSFINITGISGNNFSFKSLIPLPFSSNHAKPEIELVSTIWSSSSTVYTFFLILCSIVELDNFSVLSALTSNLFESVFSVSFYSS